MYLPFLLSFQQFFCLLHKSHITRERCHHLTKRFPMDNFLLFPLFKIPLVQIIHHESQIIYFFMGDYLWKLRKLPPVLLNYKARIFLLPECKLCL